MALSGPCQEPHQCSTVREAVVFFCHYRTADTASPGDSVFVIYLAHLAQSKVPGYSLVLRANVNCTNYRCARAVPGANPNPLPNQAAQPTGHQSCCR